MKRPNVFLILAALVFMTGNALARAPAQSTRQAIYKIVRGDTLGGLAGKYHVSVSAIRSANGLSGNLIIAGRTLQIPSSVGTRSSRQNEPQTSRPAPAASKLPTVMVDGAEYVPWTDINQHAVARGRKLGPRLTAAQEKRFSEVGATSGEIKEIDALAGQWYSAPAGQSVPGVSVGYLQKGDLVDTVVLKNGRVSHELKIVSWEGMEPGIEFSLSSGRSFIYPLCGNETRRIGRGIPTPHQPQPSTPAPPAGLTPSDPTGEFPPVTGHAPSGGPVGAKWLSRIDEQFGGGTFKGVGNDLEGNFWWNRFRVWGLEKKLGEKSQLGLGLSTLVGGSSGSADGFNFSNNRYGAGLGVKAYWPHGDAVADLLYVYQVGAGHGSGVRTSQISHQADLAATASFYKRRDEGKAAFPKTQLLLEATIPFRESAEMEVGGKKSPAEPFNTFAIAGGIRQSIYDYEFGDGWRLTPEFSVMPGYEAGPDSGVVTFGPSATLAYMNNDILQIGAGYKKYFSVDDVGLPILGYVDVGGSLRAYEAAHIKTPSAEQLQ